MLVINVAGFHFGFIYKNRKIIVPFDFKPHEIPDDAPKFRELQILSIVEENHKTKTNVVTIESDFFENSDELSDVNISKLETGTILKPEEVIVEKKVPKKRVFSKIKKIQRAKELKELALAKAKAKAEAKELKNKLNED